MAQKDQASCIKAVGKEYHGTVHYRPRDGDVKDCIFRSGVGGRTLAYEGGVG